jgi:RHS repeat-associated protein
MKLSLPRHVHRALSALVALTMLASSVLSGAPLAAAGGVIAPIGVATGPPGGSAESSPTVVREIESSRTANSATYLMSDGSYSQTIYEQPVHYKDTARHWSRIDPTLAVTPEFGVKQVKASDYDIAIASDEATDVPVSVSHDDWSFGMDLLGAEQSAMISLGNQAVYPLAMTDTALTYETGGNAVKDTLVLSSKNAPDSFTFHLSLENLRLCDGLLGDGYVLVDRHGKQVGRIEPLVVFDATVDAAGQPASVCTSASVSVAPAEGGVDVTYNVPRSWLDDPARVYPVKVDPQTVFSGTAETCDTYYSSGYATAAYSNANHIDVGKFSSSDVRRSLVSFEMDSLPEGVQIDSATLRLYCYSNSSGNSTTMIVDGVDNSWHGGSHYTWANTFGNGYLKWNSADAAWKSWSGTGYVDFNPTAIVQSWYDGRRGNYGYGFLLIANNEPCSAAKCFRSSEYATYVGQQPHLTVNYTMPAKSGSFSKTSLKPGETVTASVRVSAKQLSPNTGVEARVIGRDAQNNSVNRGRFEWSEDEGFSADSAFGDESKVDLDEDACSVAADANGRTVNFVYRVGKGYGDVQDNHLWAAAEGWTSTEALTDTGASYSVLPGVVAPSSVVTTASATWWSEAAGANDTATSGRGSAKLTWPAAPSASGYRVYLFDGNDYRNVATTTGTSWNSAGGRFYPTDTQISNLPVGTTANPLQPGTGVDLRDDPRALYAKTAGSSWDGMPSYAFKVVPYNSAGASAISDNATITAALDGRTRHLHDAPRHTEADLGALFGDAAAVRVDEGDLTLSATDLSIPGLGPQVGIGRSYRSSSTDSARLAPGWRFDFERSIGVGSSTATYTDDVGDAHVFVRVGEAWVAPRGDTDALTVDGAGSATLTHKDRSTTGFDSTGRLAWEADADGNTVRYEWASDGSKLTIRTPKDVWLVHERRITVSFSGGKVTRAVAHVSDGDADRQVTYAVVPTSLTVTRFPGTDSESVRVYRYDASGRISALAVPGFTPSAAGEAVWNVTYPNTSSVRVVNGTGAGTPTMPRTVTWNAASRTGTIASASGTMSVAFDPTGAQVSSTAENTSAATMKAYDADGNMIRETSPTGRTALRGFDGRRNVLSSTDENGARSTFVYDGDLCVSETDARGSVTTRTYWPNTTRLKTEDKTLNEEGQSAHAEYAYNADGSLQSEKKAIDASHTLEIDYSDYADCGRPRCATRQDVEIAENALADVVTRATFSGFGEEKSAVNALGTTVAASTLDSAGRVTEVADASGTVTHTRYGVLGAEARTWRSSPATTTLADWVESASDGAGNLVMETRKASDGTTVSAVAHSYDAAGREIASDDSAVPGKAVVHYDAQSNPCKVWDEGANTEAVAAATRTTFNGEGEETTSTAPGSTSASSLTAYTASGEVAEKTGADGERREYDYDRAGDLESETLLGTDQGDARTEFDNDLDGRTTEETDSNGTEMATSYDLDGNEIASELGTQRATASRVNVLGWVLSTIDFDGVVTKNVFDVGGRLVSSSTNGLVTTTDYDPCGRAWRRANPDGSSLVATYDVFGRQTGTREILGSTLIKETGASFDGHGRPVQLRVATPQWPGLRTSAVTHAADGMVTSTETCDGGGITLASCTDGTGLLRSWNAGVYGRSIDFSVVSTDLAGRVTATRSNALPLSRTATYTDAGQLRRSTLGAASADYTYGATSGKKSGEILHFAFGGRTEGNSYDYDVTGRVVSATIGGTTTRYAYDAATGALSGYRRGTVPTCTLSYETSGTGRLVAAGARTYRSDALGRRIQSGSAGNPAETTYRWQGERLVNVAGPSGVATYTYDTAGQRMSSVVTSAGLTTTTRYDYDGICLLGLSASRSDGATWTIRYLYDESDDPFAGVYRSNTASATSFAIEVADRGDVRELLDASGASFAFYSHDVYGAATMTTSAPTASMGASKAAEIADRQVLRYAGYTYDTETGLYYCSARYFDPAVAAFISRDPARADGEESLYQYCAGDPVGSVDPSGRKKKRLKQGPLERNVYDWVREQIVYYAHVVANNLKGYSPNTKAGAWGHKQGYKQAPNGYADCSGVVTWIMYKAGVFPKSAISNWNSRAIYDHALRKGIPSITWFDRKRKTAWTVGDIVQSDPPVNHVALVLSDGKNPYIIESSPTYGGAGIHRLGNRKKPWKYQHSGRYFWARAQ